MAKRRPIDFEVTPNGCFVCTSHKDDGKGYRRFRRTILMHRFIYEECYGPIPDGLIVRHKCDNRACINPEHLETGTKGDNARDMVTRRRAHKPTGSKNPKAKLTEDQAAEIYRRLENREEGKKLAAEYNVHPSTISRIKRGENWGHARKMR